MQQNGIAEPTSFLGLIKSFACWRRKPVNQPLVPCTLWLQCPWTSNISTRLPSKSSGVLQQDLKAPHESVSRSKVVAMLNIRYSLCVMHTQQQPIFMTSVCAVCVSTMFVQAVQTTSFLACLTIDVIASIFCRQPH